MAGSAIDPKALHVHMVPIVKAKMDDPSASLPGVLGSLRRSLICEESSPTTDVKIDIASIVPTPNMTR